MKRKINSAMNRNLAAVAMAVMTGGLWLAGCATSPDDTASDDTATSESRLVTVERQSDADAPITLPPGRPSPFATASFLNSCRTPEGVTVNMANGAIVSAFSNGGCRRFDGSFGGATSWSGTCFGDVSNCNGRIVCQNHCP
jgi:hypothetical protein